MFTVVSESTFPSASVSTMSSSTISSSSPSELMMVVVVIVRVVVVVMISVSSRSSVSTLEDASVVSERNADARVVVVVASSSSSDSSSSSSPNASGASSRTRWMSRSLRSAAASCPPHRRACASNRAKTSAGPLASSGLLSRRSATKRGNRRLIPRSACLAPAAARCFGDSVKSAPRTSHTSEGTNHTSGRSSVFAQAGIGGFLGVFFVFFSSSAFSFLLSARRALSPNAFVFSA
mmetsp:Transcript_6787/g.27711  ORF Transcript_6787/g.27711 Transcript_6787/m.27711 type:complete len:235 (-) Transcript_6787:1509-2213(-)